MKKYNKPSVELLNITPDTTIASLSDWLLKGGVDESNITVVTYMAQS